MVSVQSAKSKVIQRFFSMAFFIFEHKSFYEQLNSFAERVEVRKFTLKPHSSKPFLHRSVPVMSSQTTRESPSTAYPDSTAVDDDDVNNGLSDVKSNCFLLGNFSWTHFDAFIFCRNVDDHTQCYSNPDEAVEC